MFLNIDQLEKQLDNEEFYEIGSMAAFKIPEFRDTLIHHMESVKKSIDERAQHKREYDRRVYERQMQTTEEKVDTSKALDVSLVDTESSGTDAKEQDTSSRSGNDAHTDDADIRPIYDEEPITEPRFASQVDVNKDLSKPVTTHYSPKERESAVVKPHHVTASRESRNSSKNMPRFSSNDMVNNHYLEEAKKKTQERGTSLNPIKEGLRVCSELEIHDHNNELSSSKLVPKVVPPADKIATSRQEIEVGEKKEPSHNPLGRKRVNTDAVRITMLIADIEDDIIDPILPEHPSDTYVVTMKMEILLEPTSNKLLVGDSLNLPDYRIHKDGDGDALFQLKLDSLPYAHAQTTKTYYKHQDSRIMKA
ncbi:hypothetical protein Tco_0312476 [Tanacetum coccineum]